MFDIKSHRLPIKMFSILLFVISIDASTQKANSAEQPNVVFILADDMGWPDLACYGHQFHETPVLDKFAKEGMRFTSFYATPVCSSTRSTILTGQNSARTGITDFIPGHFRPFERLIVPKIDHHLKEGVQTPGNMFTKAGYATAHFGKWHVGRDKAHLPHQHGYQITERTISQAFKKTQRGKKLGPKKIDFITDASIWFMEQNQNKPFFLTVSHHAVHIPVQGNESTIKKYEAKPKPKQGVNHPVYAAMIEDMDRSIGRILDKLDELKLTNNTIVIFASDNGGLRKIYTGVGEVISTNTPLRDEKGTLYEGGVRVPLIIRWADHVKPGTQCDVPVTTADLLPTFCAMANLGKPNQTIDGSSLVPLLTQKQKTLNRDAIYFHYPHYHHSRPAGAIRKGDWKLIEFFDDHTTELYNLANDIGEKNNLVSKHPEKMKELLSQLTNWRQSISARMPTINPKYDAAKASLWWNRRANKPLDIEAMRKRYDSKRKKAGK